MMKTYYFGEVPKKYLGNDLADEAHPLFEKGKKKYYFKMTVQLDDKSHDILLEDTLGRKLPLELEVLPELLGVLDKIDAGHAALEKFYKEK